MTKAELLLHCAKKVADENPEDENARDVADKMQKVHDRYKHERENRLRAQLQVISGGPDPAQGNSETDHSGARTQASSKEPNIFRTIELDLNRPILEQLEEAAMEAGDEAAMKWLEENIYSKPDIMMALDPMGAMRCQARMRRHDGGEKAD